MPNENKCNINSDGYNVQHVWGGFTATSWRFNIYVFLHFSLAEKSFDILFYFVFIFFSNPNPLLAICVCVLMTFI